MTLPTDIYLPLPKDYAQDENPDKYLNDLVFELQNMYEQVAQVANGTYRNYADVDSSEWVPTLAGTTSAGTFTYTQQVGWALRQGLMTDLWGDVSWSATTATGNLYLELPYIVTKSNGMPFVGEVQSSALTYTGGTGIVLNAIPSTYRGEFWNVGDAFTTARQAVTASGRLIFHIRYIGTSDE